MQHYSELVERNPSLTFRHIYYGQKAFDLCKMLGINEEVAQQYNSLPSLLFGAKTDPEVECEEGIPKAIVKYKILLTVADFKEEYKDKCRGRGLANVSYRKDSIYFDELEFYPQYFLYHPYQVSITGCHGDKCRRDFTVRDTGVWCEDCHGEFYAGYNLDEVMHEQIDFRDLPKESILHIEKISKPVDDERVKEILKEEYEALLKRKQILDALEEATWHSLHKIEQEKTEIKQKLEKLNKVM